MGIFWHLGACTLISRGDNLVEDGHILWQVVLCHYPSWWPSCKEEGKPYLQASTVEKPLVEKGMILLPAEETNTSYPVSPSGHDG